MRKLLLLGAMMAFGLVATARAETYGCTVLLCTAPGAGDWRTIPACVAPVSTAIVQAYYGIPWPQCPEAAVSAAASQANANNPGSK